MVDPALSTADGTTARNSYATPIGPKAPRLRDRWDG